ncbi:MAG TPA: tetratricopeptide repeat protein, partial [Anaerolineales bacterium]
NGDRTAVVRAFNLCREVLASDLGIEPGALTRTAYDHWRNFQVEVEARPGRAGAVVGQPSQHNIPHSLTSYVGRQEDSRKILKLLEENRLITITGYGGVGKTRQAQQIALSLAPTFPDGVRWIDLAPVEEAALLTPTLLAALSSQGQLRQDQSVDMLLERLQLRRMLLVFDNCEHLARLVGNLCLKLLRSCPKLRLLCTSRTALRVPGEVIYRLPALPVPQATDRDLAALHKVESFELFIQRAQAVRPTYRASLEDATHISMICQQLSGLPLGMEMAAAWIRLFSPREIAQRLENSLGLLKHPAQGVLPHQKTMQATLDRSYNLLGPEEQILLSRLSAFRGSFTLEAAERICSDDSLQQGEILDHMAGLVDHSLVDTIHQQSGTRFRLHELTGQYAAQKLDSTGESAPVYQKLLAYYAKLAAEAESQLRGENMLLWLARLEAEQDNFRAALQFALDQGASGPSTLITLALQIIGGLWMYWSMRGQLSEGRMWTEQVLSLADSMPAEASDLCKGWYTLGSLAHFMGDYDAARQACERSLRICQECGDLAGVIHSLHYLGITNLAIGQIEIARDCLAKGYTLARELGDLWLKERMLGSRAHFEYIVGNSSQALSLFVELLEMTQISGNKHSELNSLLNIGDILFEQGEYAISQEYLQRAETLVKKMGDKRIVVGTTILKALHAQREGKLEEAHGLLLEAIQIIWEVSDLRILSVCLLYLSGLLLDAEEPALAASILGACQVLWEKMGEQLGHPIAGMSKNFITRARQDLEDTAFESALDAGRNMSLAELVSQLSERAVP